LLGRGRCFSFLMQTIGLHWRGISPSENLCLHTGQYQHNAKRYQCLELDSNLRSQCLSVFKDYEHAGVTKRDLQLWKSMQIYAEDIHKFLNCHTVAKHCKFNARCIVVSNIATASASTVEIKMATFTNACSLCVLVRRNEVCCTSSKQISQLVSQGTSQ
jgi:hypothetical protein